MERSQEKKRALLSPLPFDIIRINRKIKDGGDPGLSVNEFSTAVQKACGIAYCIDGVNNVIGEFHQFGNATLPKTIPVLESRLTALSSP